MSDERERDAANEKPKLPAKPAPAAACPNCGGSGRIVLLISSRACVRCGGTGRAGAGSTKPEARNSKEIQNTKTEPKSQTGRRPGADPIRQSGPMPGSGGAGRLDPVGASLSRTVEAPDGSVRTYDELGRL